MQLIIRDLIYRSPLNLKKKILDKRKIFLDKRKNILDLKNSLESEEFFGIRRNFLDLRKIFWI